MRKAIKLIAFCFVAACVLSACTFGPAKSPNEQHYVDLQVPIWLGALLACAILGYLASLIFWRGRRLLLGSILSLVVLAFVVAAWITTYHAQTYVMLGWCSKTPIEAHNWRTSVWSEQGTLMFWGEYLHLTGRSVAEVKPGLIFRPYWWNYAAHNPNFLDEKTEIVHLPLLESWGFQITRQPGRGGGSIFSKWLSATVPNWFLLLFCLIYPVLYFRAIRRRRRLMREGHCANCLYDLRAHAPGQKCPECGTLIAPHPASLPTPSQVPMTLECHHAEPKRAWRTITLISCWIALSIIGAAASSLTFLARWIIPLDPIAWSSFLWGWILGSLAVVVGSTCGYAAARINPSFLVKSCVSVHNYFFIMFYGLIFLASISFASTFLSFFACLTLFLTPLASLGILTILFNRRAKPVSPAPWFGQWPSRGQT